MAIQHSNPIHTSKKRSRPSSLNGVFTRHKSKIFIHCNRSGTTRSDSSFRTNKMQFHSLPSVTKRPRKVSDADSSRISIRDLRARRVFSPCSSIQNECQNDAFGANVMQNVKEEECLQSTPPEAEIFRCSVVENEGEMGFSDLQLNPVAKIVHSSVENKNNKFVLSPCSRSRVRVFKAPGSFSYRRLLPFLMDMARETNCVERKVITEDQNLHPIDQSQAVFQSGISAHLSQEPATEEKQIIEVEESKKVDNILNMSSECPLQRENMNSESSYDGMQTDSKEAGKSNAEPSCDAEVGNSTILVSPLNSVKDLQNGDEEASKHGNDEARPMDCQPTKASETADHCISLSDTTSNKGDHDGGGQGKSADSNEEHIRVAQPVAGINDKAEVNKTIVTNFGSNRLPQNPSGRLEKSCGHVGPLVSNSKNKLGLSPCAKLKRFRTPSSFSYKRMLPYLLETTQDGSGDSGSTHGFESVEANKSLKSSDIHGIPCGEQSTNCSCEMQISTYTTTNDVSYSAEQMDGTLVSHNSREQESPASTAGTEKEKPHLSAVVEGGCTALIEHLQCAKALEVSGITPNASVLCGADPLRIAQFSRKSILKRNPRGCRGPCNCLNCASFRLHAERAYEFSKNQLQDAEEIASNLVWELARLRGLLEKSGSSGDVNNDGIFSNQVKKACKKAEEAEEEAKERVSRMRYELDVHCRTPSAEAARVRFAVDGRDAWQSKTQQKGINKDDL